MRPVTYAREHPLAAACAIAVAGAGGAWIGGWLASEKVGELLFGAAITLFFATLLGGVITLLLDNARKLQERRREQARFVQAVLDDLKGAHDRVERMGVLIAAYRSVPVYGKGMRELLEAKITLRNVERAVETTGGAVAKARGDVVQMRGYVDGLTREFAVHYADLLDLHRTDPAAARERLLGLELLKELCTPDSETYAASFKAPLTNATEILRGELRRFTGGA